MAGFRAWVLEECPVAPGRRAARPAPPSRVDPGRPAAARPPPRRPRHRPAAADPAAGPDGSPVPPPARAARGGETKTARFLALVAEEHGPLAAIPLGSVARISAASAPQVGLNAGSARAALRRAVLAAQERRPDEQTR